MYLGLWRPEVTNALEPELREAVSCMKCILELNSGPLQEQHILLCWYSASVFENINTESGLESEKALAP